MFVFHGVWTLAREGTCAQPGFLCDARGNADIAQTVLDVLESRDCVWPG